MINKLYKSNIFFEEGFNTLNNPLFLLSTPFIKGIGWWHDFIKICTDGFQRTITKGVIYKLAGFFRL